MPGAIEIHWRRLRFSLAAFGVAVLAGGATAAAAWWHERRVGEGVEAAEIRLAEARGRYARTRGRAGETAPVRPPVPPVGRTGTARRRAAGTLDRSGPERGDRGRRRPPPARLDAPRREHRSCRIAGDRPVDRTRDAARSRAASVPGRPRTGGARHVHRIGVPPGANGRVGREGAIAGCGSRRRRRGGVPRSMAVRRPVRGGARLDPRHRPGRREQGRDHHGGIGGGAGRAASGDLRPPVHDRGGTGADRRGPRGPECGGGPNPGRIPRPLRTAAPPGALGARRRSRRPLRAFGLRLDRRPADRVRRVAPGAARPGRASAARGADRRGRRLDPGSARTAFRSRYGCGERPHP